MKTKHDWTAVDALTEEQIHAAALRRSRRAASDGGGAWQRCAVCRADHDPPCVEAFPRGIRHRGSTFPPARCAIGSRAAASRMLRRAPICASSPASRRLCAAPWSRFPGRISASQPFTSLPGGTNRLYYSKRFGFAFEAAHGKLNAGKAHAEGSECFRGRRDYPLQRSSSGACAHQRRRQAGFVLFELPRWSSCAP